jgi:hypothetical protein
VGPAAGLDAMVRRNVTSYAFKFNSILLVSTYRARMRFCQHTVVIALVTNLMVIGDDSWFHLGAEFYFHVVSASRICNNTYST